MERWTTSKKMKLNYQIVLLLLFFVFISGIYSQDCNYLDRIMGCNGLLEDCRICEGDTQGIQKKTEFLYRINSDSTLILRYKVRKSYDLNERMIEQSQSNYPNYTKYLYQDNSNNLIEKLIYDNNNLLVKRWVYKYDSNNYLIERKLYDFNEELKRFEGPDSYFNNYDESGNIIERLDYRGDNLMDHKSILEYDSNQNLINVKFYMNNSLYDEFNYKYDSNNNLIQYNSTFYTYDSNNNIIQEYSSHNWGSLKIISKYNVKNHIIEKIEYEFKNKIEIPKKKIVYEYEYY